jgi:hypothetical protein
LASLPIYGRKYVVVRADGAPAFSGFEPVACRLAFPPRFALLPSLLKKDLFTLLALTPDHSMHTFVLPKKPERRYAYVDI